MKSKKPRSFKSGSSRRKVPSDVSPSTSLPPLVEGQLRCFLRVTIGGVLWTVHKSPPTTFVRLRWWGESSNGTHFCPRDGSQALQKTVNTTTRYPIRCGPKQFTSYLTDMGSLVLEVLTKLDHLPIARAQIPGISCLSLSHSISGYYTLVSPTSEKLGELQVSLTLEPLAEAYDSSSSVPTTDVSIEVPRVTAPTMPSQPRPPFVNGGKQPTGSRNGNTPSGKDYLFFQSAQTNKEKDLSEDQIPIANGAKQGRTTTISPRQEIHDSQTSNDILSVILERGSKLRNAMVVSASKNDLDFYPALKDTLLLPSKDNILRPTTLSPPLCGAMLQNILHTDSSLQPVHAPVVSDYLGASYSADMENKAVDLLLGSSLNTSPPPPLWDVIDSPPESLSGHSSVYGDSELNDPQYDQSLLENLFYKAPMSDVILDDTDVILEKTMSHSKSQLEKSLPGGAEKSLKDSGLKNTDPKSLKKYLPEDMDTFFGLNMDQLAILGGIRLARVTIHSLTVPTGSSTATTPRKTSDKEKPPRPLISKKCSYFVEYVFPVMPNCSRHDPGQAVAGEVTRAVSSKVTGGVVKFQHRSVFPVHFNGAALQKWWGTDLTFKIYSRNGSQKKPILIGKTVYPFRGLLQQETLSQLAALAVQSLEGTSGAQETGPLKVSVELAVHSKGFSSVKRGPTGNARAPSHNIASPLKEPSVRPRHDDLCEEEVPSGPTADLKLDSRNAQRDSHGPFTLYQSLQSRKQVDEDHEVLLHALLMVPDGKNFICGPMKAPNFYLNCKLFGSDTARSVMSWGQTNPSFNFIQVTPVALTSKLLERMKNNFMVIEVWQRTGSTGQDRLLGLVKLPLHQFYMSFREPKIACLLLQAHYPVLGVDCYMPVIDVFSGNHMGHLRVLLAMGQSEQILALQHVRGEECVSVSPHPRPAHLLDHQPHSETKVSLTQDEAMTEHVFVVRVEKVRGLPLLQSTVWGEADCYIKYTFPCQEGDPARILDSNLIENSVNLKQFRTTTTLCVPDPVFSHSETHVLLAPVRVPVQRLFLSSLSSQGLANGGSIQFEVWCRYYYPNVRDQLVAKGMLPLSKLCAMVTMQRQQPNEVQAFSLPLMPRTEIPRDNQPQPSGLLDVCVHYKHRPLRPKGQRGEVLASRFVTLLVQVHRASGLQAAARTLSRQNEKFHYYAGVGVNAYVTVQLSFLPESEIRSTHVAARTFCPEFDFHAEVPCELQMNRSSGEICSLAELLEEASAVFTVWNRDSRKVMGIQKCKDTKMGMLKIPLANLMLKRTGVSGWFGVYLPEDLGTSHDHHILVGGLEIAIRFAHHADREKVIKTGQGLGWEMGQGELDKLEVEEAWEESTGTTSLTMSMPRAWIPVHCLLLPGHSELQRSTYCYFRYKFYDQEAFCSQMKHPLEEGSKEQGLATVAFQGTRTVELRTSQPLLWYLREERLEVQVWVAFRKDKTQRPHDTDRLVGSAFVDLSTLAKRSSHRRTVSGVYPLFRRSAQDLQGAALRVHISLTTDSRPEQFSLRVDHQEDFNSEEELSSREAEILEQGSSPTAASRQSCTQNTHKTKSPRSLDEADSQHKEISMKESIPVTITVDRAMHLSLKGCPQADGSGAIPSCSVSYVTADSAEPVSTALISNTDCPIWDHHQDCRLSKELLVDPQQKLVFKVWHKGDMDRVIGFAAVDLSPLLLGFQSVCGWYNITDISGHCRGQIKVSISPMKGVQELRRQRQAVNEETSKNSAALFQAFNCNTTAMYSSLSHISHHPEHKISFPDQMEKLFSERSCESDRHGEHMDNVRLYHQSLQEQSAAHPASDSCAGDVHPSSSVLFSALRKNLSELDDIRRYFNRKLLPPTLPSCEQVCPSREQAHQDPESDTCKLFLKSSQLVREVDNLTTGLKQHCMETIPSNSQSSIISFPTRDDHPKLLNFDACPESIPSVHRAASPRDGDDAFPLSPTLPMRSVGHMAIQTEEEDSIQHTITVSENEGKDEKEMGEKEEEEEDEDDYDDDYEEIVIEPRPLNEVTSLTDKTSPWTSILSDVDLGSQENFAVPDPNQHISYHHLTREEEGEGCFSPNTGPPPCQNPSEEQRHTRLKEYHNCESDNSIEQVEDNTDSEREDERTLQALKGEQGREPNTNKGSGDEPTCDENEPETLSLTSPESTNNPSCTTHKEAAQPQISPTMGIPNFFLPSHHLEASMRALRLAPVFSQSTSNQGPSSAPHQRAPRLRPNIPVGSMRKEETARIAKIFAAHFNKDL
ncbi:C2 domain-containing protein 3 [Lampris incognitus]|uniref:C2 domain-containing protein 3 n=1 Tax=Lampris incognitus TaxID=2546036 RepID=UPI0024B481AC|nr:C2 domain-containing protein 3 [Lampris incognitus]